MKLPLSVNVLSGPGLVMDEGATAPPLRVEIHDANGDMLDLSGATVGFRIDGDDANGQIRVHREADEIEYRWHRKDTAEPGDFTCQFTIRQGGDVLKAPSYSPARLTIHRSV